VGVSIKEGNNIAPFWVFLVSYTKSPRVNRLVSKGWAPRTEGSHLMYPCKQVTEAIKIFLKDKVWPIYCYMQFYRLLHPSASALFFTQNVNVTFFTFGFFRFYLFAMPPCYFIRTQACLFLFWSSSLLQPQLGLISPPSPKPIAPRLKNPSGDKS
jgi:hypothetical protein